jgi:hypothetical protein
MAMQTEHNAFAAPTALSAAKGLQTRYVLARALCLDDLNRSNS